MKHFALTILLMSFALSDSLNLNFGLFSNHSGEYNEKHNAIGITYSKDIFDFELLKFKNSYYRDTTIATAAYRYHFNDNIAFKTSIGIQKGYCGYFGKCDKGENDVGLVILPSLYLTYDRFVIDILPPFGDLKFAIKVSYKVFEF